MRLGGLFSEKPLLKLLSLLLATVLWLFVSLGKNDEMDLAVPVTFANLPSGFTIKGEANRMLSLRGAGAKILLLRQSMQEQSLIIDLSGVQPGRTTLTGFEQRVRLLPGIQIVRVQPAVIDVLITENANYDAQKERRR